jgi:hypothetical protein
VAGRAFREERAIIWGSGSKCVAFLTAIDPDEPVEKVVDINPYRHGKFLPGVGVRIVPPSRLTELSPGKIIVMNPVYEAEIGSMLEKMGIEAGTIPVE